jgi:hypothetical protein
MKFEFPRSRHSLRYRKTGVWALSGHPEFLASNLLNQKCAVYHRFNLDHANGSRSGNDDPARMHLWSALRPEQIGIVYTH